MKTLIIVESKHCGNTRRLADAMANNVPDTVVTDTKGLEKYSMKDFDLVGFGSGIYAGNFDARIIDVVNALDNEPGNVFVFSTSGAGDVNYNSKLINVLEAKNKSVLGSFACKGLDKFFILKLFGGANKGSPSEKDLQDSVSFLEGLQNKISSQEK